MGEEKPNVEDLVRRVDELIRILKFLSEDLAEISNNLKASSSLAPSTQPSEPPTRLPQPKSSQQTITLEGAPASPAAPARIGSAEDIQAAFPPELSEMLYFEVADEYVLVKPRQYLGSDNFRQIAAIVRDQLGGEYVSAGKDSHFQIPKRT
jgi:hypothetical protein